MNSNSSSFQVEQTYSTRSVCDHDCVFSFVVVSRTDKTVTVLSNSGKTRRCKIQRDARGEWIFPLGQFSMCPILRSSDNGLS